MGLREQISTFSDFFSEHSDKFLVIGGIATHLLSEEAGIQTRVTKDFDIVILAEVTDIEFGKKIWEFIELGKYQIMEKDGEKILYRFAYPKDDTFPHQLEFLSKKADFFDSSVLSNITPTKLSDGVSSLSAIILDDEYYDLIRKNKIIIKDIPIITVNTLILLKAKAYNNLVEQKKRGESVKSKDIKKHKNDIFFRLLEIANPEEYIAIPETIKKDLRRFCDMIINELDDLTDKTKKDDFVNKLELLQKIYSL